MKKGTFKLDIRKKFFTTNFVKCWNIFPRDVVDSQSGWIGFWATWSNWRWNYSLQGGWTRWTLQVPSSPNHFMIWLWFNIYYMWSLIHFECACLVLLSSSWMRMKSMYEESGLVFWFFFCSQWVFSFNTSTTFEASPFHFSVLEVHFSQLACSPLYSSPEFPGVCGLPLKQK